MKSALLLIAVLALLVAQGLAQTPAASPSPDQTNIKGCLGGSDGNYTVAGRQHWPDLQYHYQQC